MRLSLMNSCAFSQPKSISPQSLHWVAFLEFSQDFPQQMFAKLSWKDKCSILHFNIRPMLISIWAFKTTWMRRFCQMLLSKFKQLIYVLLFVCRPTVQPYRIWVLFIYKRINCLMLQCHVSHFKGTPWRWMQHYSLVPCFKHLGDYMFQGNE